MICRRAFAALVGVLLAAFCAGPASLCAQEFVVFKAKIPFDAGGAMPDSARMNDYYIKIGAEDGVQIGTIMNVYRDQELESDFGGFKLKTTAFVGRIRAFEVRESYTVGRVSALASYSDPHRERNAVMVGDYVQPVFVVQSENLFDRGSGTLRPEAIRELDRAVGFIKRYHPIKVRIEGHTDGDGEEDLNMILSEERAKSVLNYLVNQGGIEASTLVPVGYGESKPIASNETPEGKRKNRRFEIVIER